jgi:hypothetical protein
MKLKISDTSALSIDLPVLLKTRLLIQANSGGGKSWLLRRLAEQMFGKVQVIIIDPEGEFSTLREKFDYVLVGKGGETPADCRSAGLVAHKLLELHASAVCDLYELKPQERHHWVKLFIDALIDAPKNFWHSVVIIVDEAHIFCPENKAGESEASSSMIDLATRGRKRGFCAIFATQRLGKLKKDAAAELTNVMIGQTFIDIDRDRAADCLGVSGKDRHPFDAEIKTLEQGNFFALGRAICIDRTKVKVGGVQTSHPEIGGKKFSAEPPPPSDKVRLMMPKLADLPKAAEDKARTEAELRSEIRQLKSQLKSVPAQQSAPPSVEIKSVPALTDAERKRLTRLIDVHETFVSTFNSAKSLMEVFSVAKDEMRDEIVFFKDLLAGKLVKVKQPLALNPARIGLIIPSTTRRLIPPKQSVHIEPKIPESLADPMSELVKFGLKDMKCLSVLSNFPDGVDAGKLMLLSGYKWNGDSRNALSRLRTSGAMVGGNQEIMRITEYGMSLGPFPQMPQGRALIDYWLQHPEFGQKDRTFLRALVDNPEGLTSAQLCEITNYEWNGDTRNALSRLRTAGVMEGRNGEVMKLAGHLLEHL